MRTAKNTGVSKRAAEEMMRAAAMDAASHSGPAKMTDATNYLHQLTRSYLTVDQLIAIECLLDVAFEGGKAAAKLGK